MRLGAGSEQVCGELVVIAEQAAGDMPQRDDAGPGEGGQINHRVRLEFCRISQRIAQHQTPFGIGIQDLDTLAGHRSDDIAGFGGFA